MAKQEPRDVRAHSDCGRFGNKDNTAMDAKVTYSPSLGERKWLINNIVLLVWHTEQFPLHCGFNAPGTGRLLQNIAQHLPPQWNFVSQNHKLLPSARRFLILSAAQVARENRFNAHHLITRHYIENVYFLVLRTKEL